MAEASIIEYQMQLKQRKSGNGKPPSHFTHRLGQIPHIALQTGAANDTLRWAE
jgi:hypothetical protein